MEIMMYILLGVLIWLCLLLTALLTYAVIKLIKGDL